MFIIKSFRLKKSPWFPLRIRINPFYGTKNFKILLRIPKVTDLKKGALQSDNFCFRFFQVLGNEFIFLPCQPLTLRIARNLYMFYRIIGDYTTDNSVCR